MSETLGSLRVAINLDNSGMDRPLKEIKAGLKATQEQFKASMLITESLENKTESLGQKYKGLEQVLKQQATVAMKQEKTLETLRNSENVSIETVKKAEAQYYQYIQAMRKTENEMIKTKKEIDGLSKSEDKAATNAKKMGSELADLPNKTNGFTASLKGIAAGVVAAFAVDKVAGFVKGIVEASAELQALDGQYSQVMGKMKNQTDKYIDQMGKKWNKHPNELKSAMMQYMAILKGKGLSEKQALETSKKYLEMTVDGNAFANENMSDSIARTMGIIKGEYDSADTLMINFSQTLLNNKALEVYKKKWDKLTVSQQESLKTQEAIRQQSSAGVTGQGQRESNSYANNLAQVQQKWKVLKAELGAPILEKVNKALGQLGKILDTVDIGKLSKDFSTFFNDIKTNTAPVFTELKSSLGELWTTLSGVFMDLSAAFRSGGGEPMKFKDILIQVIQTVIKNITTAVKVITAVIEFIKPFLTDLAQFIGSVFAQIKAFWDENGAGIMEGIKIFVITITAIFETIWQFVSPVLTFLWTSVKALFQLGVNTIMNYIKIMTSFIRGDFKGVKEGVLNIISGMFTALDKVFGGYWDMVKGTLSTLVENIKGAFNIDLSQIGKDMINGLIGGIDSVMDTLKTKIEGMGDKIPDWLKKKLGIKSPSRVLASQIGRHLPTGIALGIDQSMPKLHTAVQKMGQATIPALQGNSFQGTNSNSIHQTFSPSITINGSSNPYELVREQERLLKRLSFKGGY